MNAYQEFIKESDTTAMMLYRRTLFDMRVAFWIYVLISVGFLIITIGLQYFGIQLLFGSVDNSLQGLYMILAGLLALVILLFHNPLKEFRRIFGDFVKIQIVYLGHMQQMNLIHISFQKNIYLEQNDLKKVEKSVQQVQEIIEYNIQILDQALDDM